MADIAGKLAAVVGAAHVLPGTSAGDDYTHDEALTARPVTADLVVRPGSTDEVAEVLRLADEHRVHCHILTQFIFPHALGHWVRTLLSSLLSERMC